MNAYIIPRLVFFSLMAIVFWPSHGQLARYEFNNDFQDQFGSYHAVEQGNPMIESGEYVTMGSYDYLLLPNALSAAIDTSASLEIRVRFKVEGDWQSTADEDARVILSSKEDYDQRLGGFDITARQWEGQLRIITTYGDGINYGPPIYQSEGKLDFVSEIDSGIWYELIVRIFFDAATPYIQYIVNNSVSTSYFDDRLDYDGFKRTISQQMAVGSDINNHINLFEPPPSLDLQVDYLVIASPVLSGDPDQVGTVIGLLTDHLQGTTTLPNETIDSLHGVFVANWDQTSYQPNKASIHTYMEAYSVVYGPIFDQPFKESPDGFHAMEAIQYQMQQWILDNQYGGSTVVEMEGLTFKDHELFPGTVSNAAPRISDATFTIDGDYQTDPGFHLNDQEEVIRPSGYYVAPGELVTITVPDAAIRQDMTLFVGAHRKNVQETWNEFTRYPRISTQYAIESKTITVANPFGGGIYLTVPDGKQLGPLTFEVDGAIKAPYYSTKEGFSTSLEEFQSEVANAHVPWADIESSKFMCTIPHGMVKNVVSPDSVLSVWDDMFDAVNIALGRPLERFRGEYLMVDRNSHAKFTAAPAAYPMSLETVAFPYEYQWDEPVVVGQGREWYKGLARFNYIIFHEYGHLHNMPTLPFEQETNVHIPATAAYSIAMGESIDSAFVYSQNQRLTLEEATLDWIVTPNFYEGNRIGYEIDGPWDQLLYQSRGLVKLVDIAKMFGWEAYGEINQYFYDYQIANPDWSPYSLEDDQFIAAASEVLGVNMAPHFEFHGILPSDILVSELQSLPTSEIVKERLLHYRATVPADNEAIQHIYHSMVEHMDPNYHVPRWDSIRIIYDEVHAAKIIGRIDTIIDKYYNLTAADLNQEPVIIGLVQPIVISENTSFTLSLADLEVEDTDHTYPDDFILSVHEGEHYTLDGYTITPELDFSGTLNVPVTVSDGIEESEVYTVNVEIQKLNIIPVITGLSAPILIPQDTPWTLSLTDFIVEDDDHDFPGDFTLTVSAGENYSVDDHTIMPAEGFVGELLVSVTVNDGIDESDIFEAPLEVFLVLNTQIYQSGTLVYPNPAGNVLYLKEQDLNQVRSIDLTSLDGKLIKKFLPADVYTGINLNDLTSGTYLLQVKTDTQINTLKIHKR
ncbi:MAG: M60 family peptidase N-terminal accessory domain-containing protein [Cytophagales bacterium]|nr:M60 family peptidase N-terminal accessory domain-containing protein [Cytophagales bacterium]